ncbi:MAG: DMT family transporter [Chloroflexi bacterium]|nr:MAG: DMT family transporter [Chloroflexota bacterium]
MNIDTTPPRIGWVYMTIAIMGYSLVAIFSKKILDDGFPVLDLAIWRFVIAVPVMWLIIVGRNAVTPTKSKKQPRPIGLLLIGLFISMSALTSFASLERIDASVFMVLFFTFPAIVALLSLFRGERLTTQGWLALAMTMVGVVLTAPGFFSGFGDGDAVGIFMALLSAFVVAVYFMFNPRAMRGYTDRAQASAWATTGALLPLIGLAAVRGVDTPAEMSLWPLIIGLATISTALAIFSLMASITYLGPTRTAILSTAELPLSIILAVVLLGESIAPIQIFGSILVMVALVLLNVPVKSLRPIADALTHAERAGSTVR